MNCRLVPAAIVSVGLLTAVSASETSVGGPAVSVVLPVIAPEVAVIVTVPW